MVIKRNNRSKTICEFNEKGLFPDVEFPAVDSCLDFEGSVVMILLGLIIKFRVEILAVAGLLIFCGEALFLIFRSLQQSNEKCFWFLFIMK